MEEQITQKKSKVTKGAVTVVPWFWLLNHFYAFGIKLVSAVCETLCSGTLVQEAQARVLSISPASLVTLV